MTKTIRRILLMIAVLFCVICYMLLSKGFDVRVGMPLAAAAIALANVAVMHP